MVIPIYNGAADLPDLLSCLEQQTYTSENLEYLLVDNNSQDNTAHLIAEAVKTTSIPLKLLSETEIQSSYAARNRGIQSSTSDLIAFTDADCRPEPTWLEQLLQPFNQPEIGLVAGEILALPHKPSSNTTPNSKKPSAKPTPSNIPIVPMDKPPT